MPTDPLIFFLSACSHIISITLGGLFLLKLDN